ncbi:MAG: hypothetical protein SH817_11425 [Leptospira sp.]|nr:hypothetical protein [Leptospira sp.]
MNTINSKTNWSKLPTLFFAFIFTITIVINCNPQTNQELRISNVQLCDNFDLAAHCTEPKPEKGIVTLKPTSSGKEKLTWENFGNYLYFTARETPGFVIQFSRPLSPAEKKEITSKYVAYIYLGDTKEKMEGFEMGDDSLASFHYLGALLKEAKRHSHDYNKKPDFDNLKPLLIQFEYQISPVIKGTLQREISFTWL